MPRPGRAGTASAARRTVGGLPSHPRMRARSTKGSARNAGTTRNGEPSLLTT